MTRTRLRLLSAIIAAVMIFTAIPTLPASAATTLVLESRAVTLGEGETFKVKSKTNAKETIAWTSSKDTVATVDASGVISAKKVGTTTIKATVGGVSKNVKVTVKKAPDKISVVSAGGLVFAVLPAGTASNQITFKSSNTKIATIDNEGIIRPKPNASGNFKIQATTFNGKSATVNCTVEEYGPISAERGHNVAFFEQIFEDGKEICTYYTIWENAPEIRKGLYIRKGEEGSLNLEQITDDSMQTAPRTAIVADGDWIYYVTENGDLYRIKQDGTEKGKLVDKPKPIQGSNGEYGHDNAIDLQDAKISEDWLYYKTVENYTVTGLHRIKTDGSSKNAILKGVLSEFQVDDDWVYYTIPSNNQSILYRVKTDGKNREIVVRESKSISWEIYEDRIYYGFSLYTAEAGPNYRVYSVEKSNGKNKVAIYEDSYRLQGLIVDAGKDGWIYCCQVVISDDGKMNFMYYRIKPDGTAKTSVSKAQYEATRSHYLFVGDPTGRG